MPCHHGKIPRRTKGRRAQAVEGFYRMVECHGCGRRKPLRRARRTEQRALEKPRERGHLRPSRLRHAGRRDRVVYLSLQALQLSLEVIKRLGVALEYIRIRACERVSPRRLHGLLLIIQLEKPGRALRDLVLECRIGLSPAKACLIHLLFLRRQFIQPRSDLLGLRLQVHETLICERRAPERFEGRPALCDLLLHIVGLLIEHRERLRDAIHGRSVFRPCQGRRLGRIADHFIAGRADLIECRLQLADLCLDRRARHGLGIGYLGPLGLRLLRLDLELVGLAERLRQLLPHVTEGVVEARQGLLILKELLCLAGVDVGRHVRVIGLVVQHLLPFVPELLELDLCLLDVLSKVVVGAAVLLAVGFHLLASVVHGLELVIRLGDHLLQLFERLRLDGRLRRLSDLLRQLFDVCPCLLDLSVILLEGFGIPGPNFCRGLIDLCQRLLYTVKAILDRLRLFVAPGLLSGSAHGLAVLLGASGRTAHRTLHLRKSAVHALTERAYLLLE